MSTGRTVRNAGRFSVCFLGLILAVGLCRAAPPTGTTGTPTTTTPNSTTTNSGTGTSTLFAFPLLTSEQDAQLLMQATTVVDTLLTFLQLTLPAEEEAMLVAAVFRMFQILALFAELGSMLPTTNP
jgi:hypothetical protein